MHHGRRGRAAEGRDPFIFGRGAEEVEALAAAGVPYQVVPGVSTLTAVPGLAGIPLTSRDVAAQVTVLTGTSADGSELDYDRLAGTPGTLGAIARVAGGPGAPAVTAIGDLVYAARLREAFAA